MIKVFKSIWNFFCKVKVALWLMIILAVSSILGTLIPQNNSKYIYYKLEYISLKSIFLNAGYYLYNILNLSNIYYSWWYIFLLFLLSINLIICTIEKLPIIWGFITLQKKEVSDVFIKDLKYYKEIELSKEREKLKKILKKFGFLVYDTKNGLYGERGRISRLGSTITHLSLIVIFIGSIISLTKGFKGVAEIAEGERHNNYFNRKTGKYDTFQFDIQLNKFNIEYYPRKISLKIKDIKKELVKKYDVFENDSFELDINSYRIKVERFDENYIFKDESIIKKRFPGSYNPAVELSLYKDDKLIKKGWFFWGYPEFQEFIQNGFLVRLHTYWDLVIKDYKSEISVIENGRFILTKTIEVNDPLSYKGITLYQTNYRFLEDEKIYVSGFQVVKDPGVWPVYSGCILMILGVIFSFYIYHERIWINIYYNKGSNKNKILIGGTCNKNYLSFNKKFNKILKEIVT